MKGWKQVVNQKNKMHWESTIEDEKEIFITPAVFSNLTGRWETTWLQSPDDTFTVARWKSKVFSSKKLALAFAMKYMRDN
jgi:hypothetical protein